MRVLIAPLGGFFQGLYQRSPLSPPRPDVDLLNLTPLGISATPSPGPPKPEVSAGYRSPSAAMYDEEYDDDDDDDFDSYFDIRRYVDTDM